MVEITWKRMRQQQEPMRLQQEQRLEQMPQQRVQQQERQQVLERLLLFCRKRTKQLQR